MKISYERLNEIIEEEVSRFKNLNEQVGNPTPVDSSTLKQLNSLLDDARKFATMNQANALAVISAVSKFKATP
jgi:hypothetical protein